MAKLSCEIIQDLIPSYADEICSDATKAYVEEHLKECSHCKKKYDVYRNMEISDLELEKKQIDGFKKINTRMKAMNRFSIVLIALLVGLGIYTFYSNTSGYLSAAMFYILLPVCLIGLSIFINKNAYLPGPSLQDYVIGISSVVVTFCATAFMMYAIHQMAHDQKVFFLAPEELGPFLHGLWVCAFALLLFGFVYLLRRMTHHSIYTKPLLCFPITGMFLLLTYVTLLSNLSSIDNFYRRFVQHTLILSAIGLFSALAFWRTRPKN